MLPVEKLSVFQKAYKNSFKVHALSLKIPRIEQYKGLAVQLRDASKSIVFNLTEGYSFKTCRIKRFIHHLEISIGSCDETKIVLKYAFDLRYIDENEYLSLAMEYEEIGKMLWGMLKSVKQ